MRALSAIVCVISMGAISCGGGGAKPEGPPSTAPTETAVTTLKGPEGSAIQGTVTFIQQGDEVRIVADVAGAPEGKHGIHLHEHGDCGGEAFANAGGHFNPTDAPHACPPTEPRHAGDFGNIDIDADGKGHLELTTRDLTVSPGPKSVVGKAVVLHAHADDCESQPAGDSGARIACGAVHTE